MADMSEWEVVGYGNRITADDWTTYKDVNGNVVGPAPTEADLDRATQVTVRIVDVDGNQYFIDFVSMRGFLPYPDVIEGDIISAVQGGSGPVEGLTTPELV